MKTSDAEIYQALYLEMFFALISLASRYTLGSVNRESLQACVLDITVETRLRALTACET